MSNDQTEFLAALNGGKGDLDAWLEVNDEAEVRAAIKAAIAAQAQEAPSDAEVLRNQVSAWRKEVDRLNDLICFATAPSNERVQFEAWARRNYPSLDLTMRDSDDNYYYLLTRRMWQAWQARAAAPASAQAAAPTQAACDVLAERQRQISVEGWTPEHDDEHSSGAMANAAACYALHTEPVGNVGDYLRFWPWGAGWWKPKDRRRNLVKACALILAEIERLDRAAAPSQQGGGE